jgi:hypothetical protein
MTVAGIRSRLRHRVPSAGLMGVILSLSLVVASCREVLGIGDYERQAKAGAGRGGVAGSSTEGGAGGLGGSGGAATAGIGGSGAKAGEGGSAGTLATGGAGVAGDGGTGRGGAPACADSADSGVIVYYVVGNTQDSSQQIHFHLYFKNNSDQALDLGRVTVRYWMTAETDAFNPPTTDYRGPQVAGEHAEYVEDGEFSHLRITFNGSEIPARNWNPDLEIEDINPTEVQFRVQARAEHRFDQSNDYSFAPRSMTKQPNDRITAYLDGKLVWGRTPSGLCSDLGEGGQAGAAGEGGNSGSANSGGEGGV